jgi:hypothetical protein
MLSSLVSLQAYLGVRRQSLHRLKCNAVNGKKKKGKMHSYAK